MAEDKDDTTSNAVMSVFDKLNPTFGASRKFVGGIMDARKQEREKSAAKNIMDSPMPESTIPDLLPSGRKWDRNQPQPLSARKGGRVKKDGVFRLHKDEIVIPAKVVKRMEKRKSSRKSGRR